MGNVVGTFYLVARHGVQSQRGRDAEGLKLTSSTTAGLVQDKDGNDWTAPSDGVVELECDEIAWVKISVEGTAAATNDAIRLKAAEVKWAYVLEGDQISIKDDVL